VLLLVLKDEDEEEEIAVAAMKGPPPAGGGTGLLVDYSSPHSYHPAVGLLARLRLRRPSDYRRGGGPVSLSRIKQ
jgi:hypothetical protein